MSETVVKAPSNIALVKYWGKADPSMQWPASDSLSMTLRNSFTSTRVTASQTGADAMRVAGLTVGGERKALQHLKRLRQEVKAAGPLAVESENSFPTGCGIASSASGLAALTLGAIAHWTGSRSFEDLEAAGFDRTRLAHLARMGSGSAGRSMHPGFVSWERGPAPVAQRINGLWDHDHWPLADLIVVISSEEKKISSSEAHLAAPTSPLFAPRLADAPRKMRSVLGALANRDMQALGETIEQEALEMHAVMMTSQPAARYLSDATLEMVTWLRQTREDSGLPAWFTIDAGPNVHVICEERDATGVVEALAARFPMYEILRDGVGAGPEFVIS